MATVVDKVKIRKTGNVYEIVGTGNAVETATPEQITAMFQGVVTGAKCYVDVPALSVYNEMLPKTSRLTNSDIKNLIG